MVWTLKDDRENGFYFTNIPKPSAKLLLHIKSYMNCALFKIKMNAWYLHQKDLST